MDHLNLLARSLPLLLAVVAGLVLLSLWGFYSSIRPPRLTSPVTPRDFGLDYDDINLTTKDGLRLAGWFIPNQETDKTIILLHGYPADKGNILPAMAFLAQHYNLLLFDFRYHGASAGAYTTIGAKETADLSAAIEWLQRQGYHKIGLWGFSLGGAVALMTASDYPTVKAVISEASYANLNLMVPALYPLPGLRYPLAALTRLWGKIFLGLDSKAVSPAASAQQLTIPVLIIHSKNDTTITFNHAQLIKASLANNQQAQFWFADNLIHGQFSQEYDRR
ncbi:alpha/beta fold hydrolase, partial [Patescibacteria group bacterium]|nr:alpha/beta fold hydrolase [Patescibacteria group bacterium]